jgi:hypothetical protein
LTLSAPTSQHLNEVITAQIAVNLQAIEARNYQFMDKQEPGPESKEGESRRRCRKDKYIALASYLERFRGGRELSRVVPPVYVERSERGGLRACPKKAWKKMYWLI